MTAQALANKYFAEYQQNRIANIDLALEDHKFWTSMSVPALLIEPLEVQAKFADYVVKKMVKHKQQIVRQFALDSISGLGPNDKFRTQVTIGGFALMILTLHDCEERRKLIVSYERAKYNTIGSFWSRVFTEVLEWFLIFLAFVLPRIIYVYFFPQ